MSVSSDLHDELLDRAARGEWWDPEGRPEVPADWIRDLVVTGKAGKRDVHAKGVRIRGVTLVGALDFKHAALETPLVLSDVDVAGPIDLDQATATQIVISNSRLAGITGVELGLKHSLVMKGTHVEGPVNLLAAHIIGDVNLSGVTTEGEVRLYGATIGGNLSCADGTFHNPDGVALNATLAEVAGAMFLHDGFAAEGEVTLQGATIGAVIQCSDGTFHNPDGYALNAQGVEVAGPVFLSNGFAAEGEVTLYGATIGGNLECADGTFHNPDGIALGADLLTVRRLTWAGVSEVTGTVVLRSAYVSELVDDPASWEHADMAYVLEGLTVDRLAPMTWQERKAWLTSSEEPNQPGPYEMVARWYRSVGRDHDARQIAIAKQKAHTATLTWWRKPFHRLWGLFAGYGYQPLKAVAVLAGAWVWGVLVFSPGRMDPTQTPPAYEFHRWVYSADTVIPLVDFKQAAWWAPNDTAGLVTMWALIAAGWILSLALVAAVSGLYTKD